MHRMTRRELREAILSVLEEEIRKVKGGWKVYSKKGKPLSKEPKTKKDALKHLRAIEMSKAMSEGDEELDG